MGDEFSDTNLFPISWRILKENITSNLMQSEMAENSQKLQDKKD